MTHVCASFVSIFILLATACAHAVEIKDLYKAETIVTGTEEPERSRGFRIGLEEVLIKLSGDARLAGSSRLAPYAERVRELVTAFEYEDRMKGLPVRDEQGTRERPHFLRMSFDGGKIDAVLRQLSLAKWPSQRPLLAVWLAVRDARARYLLAADGEYGYGQREVLKSASRRRGVPVVLPPADAAIAYGDVAGGKRVRIAAAARALGADGMLYGTLTLDAEGFYWDATWSLDCGGRAASWARKGVSFDTALRGAIDRAMLMLSGAGS